MPSIKKRLRACAGTQNDIDNQISRLEIYAERRLRVGGGLKADGSRSQLKTDTLQRLSNNYLDEKRRLEESIREQAAETREIKALINCLDKTNDRTLIYMRYIDRFNWYDITRALYGQTADFNENYDSYKNRVNSIHRRALIKLQKITDEKNIPK